MDSCSFIMAILQQNRVETAPSVQNVLTKYGCYIHVRLGLHEAAAGLCNSDGLILLQLAGADLPLENFIAELEAIDRVKVKVMELDF